MRQSVVCSMLLVHAAKLELLANLKNQEGIANEIKYHRSCFSLYVNKKSLKRLANDAVDSDRTSHCCQHCRPSSAPALHHQLQSSGIPTQSSRPSQPGQLRPPHFFGRFLEHTGTKRGDRSSAQTWQILVPRSWFVAESKSLSLQIH